ncbi:MAG: hypothetical protein HYY45_08005 [Deltaproteobacteria bacterium]|nr:hypothetical protein [Deltaproteobacteria bacterium]
MIPTDIERDVELQRILWACHEYWRSEPLPIDQRAVCYTWVTGPYEKAFGTQFHQSRLHRLTKLGFLQQAETSRGGGRHYYTLINPEEITVLLKKWNLN